MGWDPTLPECRNGHPYPTPPVRNARGHRQCEVCREEWDRIQRENQVRERRRTVANCWCSWCSYRELLMDESDECERRRQTLMRAERLWRERTCAPQEPTQRVAA